MAHDHSDQPEDNARSRERRDEQSDAGKPYPLIRGMDQSIDVEDRKDAKRHSVEDNLKGKEEMPHPPIITGMMVFVGVAFNARLPFAGWCGWLKVPGTGRRDRRSVGDKQPGKE